MTGSPGSNAARSAGSACTEAVLQATISASGRARRRPGAGQGASGHVLRGARAPRHARGVGGQHQVGVGPQPPHRGGRRQQPDTGVHQRDLHPVTLTTVPRRAVDHRAGWGAGGRPGSRRPYGHTPSGGSPPAPSSEPPGPGPRVPWAPPAAGPGWGRAWVRSPAPRPGAGPVPGGSGGGRADCAGERDDGSQGCRCWRGCGCCWDRACSGVPTCGCRARRTGAGRLAGRGGGGARPGRGGGAPGEPAVAAGAGVPGPGRGLPGGRRQHGRHRGAGAGAGRRGRRRCR